MILCTDLKSDRRELPLAMPPGFPVPCMDSVLRFLDVERAPRYQPGDGATWCNVFVTDVALAWGAVLPHWVAPDEDPGRPYHGRELTANGISRWLESPAGGRHGWTEIPLADAQSAANTDQLVVLSWRAPLGQHGHCAVVRPGPWGDGSPWIAAAG